MQDYNADLRVGWDSESKNYKLNRRVAIVRGSYVVIVQIKNDMKEAKFITAFIADNDSLQRILSGPKWK